MPATPLLRSCRWAWWVVPTLALGACGGDNDELAPVIDTACALSTSSGSVVVGSGVPGDPAIPEPASGYKLGAKPVVGKNYMVVTANPLASQAGCEILKKGGSAADAAVAVQAVLGLVEPQSSGLGGGAFMLHYNAATKVVQAYDGREQAPAAATQDYLRYISATNTAYPLPAPATATTDGAAFAGVRASGRSVGTPGAVRMLEMAHQDNGKLAWNSLFGNGIKLATDGFKISGRLADAISVNRAGLLVDGEATALYYGPGARLHRQTLGHRAEEPGLCRQPQRHRRGWSQCLLHRADCPGHRRQDQGHGRQRPHHHATHAGPDRAQRPGRLQGRQAHRGVHHLPGLVGVRHAPAVIGRHRGGTDPGHSRKLQHARFWPRPPWTAKAASPR